MTSVGSRKSLGRCRSVVALLTLSVVARSNIGVVSLGFLDVDGGYSQHNSDKVEWAQTSSLIAACHSIIADAVEPSFIVNGKAQCHANGASGEAGGQTRPTPASQYPFANFAEFSELCLAANVRSQPPLMEFGRKLRQLVESN